MVKELFALGGWFAAFFVMIYYSEDIAKMLPLGSLGSFSRLMIAAVLILVVCIFLAGLLGNLIRSALSSASIGVEDRILGCLFGFLRGMVLVGILVYLGGSTQFIARQETWKTSVFVPYVERGIVICMPYLPDEIRKLTQ